MIIKAYILMQNSWDDVSQFALEKGTKYRNSAKGYGIGPGNSIPEYVSTKSFKAMIDAVAEDRSACKDQ
jgi:uroporphyrinogen decarboxylase